MNNIFNQLNSFESQNSKVKLQKDDTLNKTEVLQ